MILDGDGDGVVGDSYSIDAADGFYRKYGDRNANGIVDLFDFAAFRSSFGKSRGDAGYLDEFDSNNNGVIDLFDFARFRSRFGS